MRYTEPMTKRLTRIVTRGGDAGTTGLADGSRLPKHHPRVAALGEVDELNSQIGLLLTEPLPAEIAAALQDVQQDLFDLGAELALPGQARLAPGQVEHLESLLAEWNAALPPLEEFVLPGGCRGGALCHVARAVCRRAERSLSLLGTGEALSPLALPYLNRLSDLLFVASRRLNRAAGVADAQWHGPNPRPNQP
ncbi:MAG: cob(I)yrinic acid a,c-diamide adenosyltransferase [Sulfuricellaceae bacterium]|jgi:cob(I)alamin adenosyltransferase